MSRPALRQFLGIDPHRYHAGTSVLTSRRFGGITLEADLDFYIRRAGEERRLAEHALSSEAQRTHTLLAETYERKARELDPDRNAPEPRKRLKLKPPA